MIRRTAARLEANDHLVLQHLQMLPPRHWGRPQLVAATGLSDRALRKSLERLRMAGHPVISPAGEGGYRLARTPDEIREYRERQLRSRARVLLYEDRQLKVIEQDMRARDEEGVAVPLAVALL